jgi:hypothetical protein
MLIKATLTLLLVAALSLSAHAKDIPIDRQALVSRHNPVIRSVDVDAPLTVGNGGFAFTSDITGLQTFAEQYQRQGIPTEILSRWCWVTDPNPNNYTLADASKDFTQADGRVVAYPTKQSSVAGDWLRKNPRNHPLGQLALEYSKSDGSAFTPTDIQSPEQTLDLWRGIITSHFKLDGIPVSVTTTCHPESDTIAVRIESELVSNNKLSVRLGFPRGHDTAVKNTPGLDWSHPESHRSLLTKTAPSFATIARTVGSTQYNVAVNAVVTETAPHIFRINGAEKSNVLEFCVTFTDRGKTARTADATQTFAASTAHWENFWRNSAAVDFSGSADPRASKLEERIILSRYLMAVQMAGDVPPQETGLTCSTWYGKHHSEMIWWHTAQFALWGNDALLEKNLTWFQSQLPAARTLAASRGLKGARWAKMTGPEMRESPGGNPLIVWNQPHLIYLCELLYRNNPSPALLAKYRELVLETADCLATMVHFDAAKDVYVLGPPLWIAQEIYDQATSQNPSFELAYWHWALGVAQQWRERLGLPRDQHWDHVITHLAPVPQKDGKYVALGSNPDTWDNIESRHDHPTMLAPLGVLPGGSDVDRPTMERTLDAVLQHWDWKTKIWGWDYPMIAMTATRLGRPETALEILLREGPNNHYLPNGHCPQRSDEKLANDAPPGARKREIAVYLPANGAFLSAVALMVAGWDGAPRDNPGFPSDGSWKIKSEGLKPLP